jgi:hypothetical protein
MRKHQLLAALLKLTAKKVTFRRKNAMHYNTCLRFSYIVCHFRHTCGDRGEARVALEAIRLALAIFFL